jgi:uncharacterized protein YndB with AHSA1/START domain
MASATTFETKVEITGDTESVITRTFKAPRSLVFEAMTNPKHVSRWWGPRNLTTEIVELDLRAGGKWRYLQTDENGEKFPFCGEYLSVNPVTDFSYTFIFDVEPYNQGEPIVESIVLTESDGLTTVTNTSTYPSKEVLDGMVATGMEWGARESLDRLAELLESLQ